MIRFLNKYGSLFAVSCILAAFFAACANMASPTGGDYDFDPPKVVRTFPAFNATNVTNGKIVLEFDENVVLEKQSEKVIITPPQTSFPIIQSVNRKVTVQLKDSLQPNTTYTIDFTDAIVDNNEKNALENFSFSFSTGDYVDTLSVSGKVLEAENLEPVKGMYVGLHSNLNDTAFSKTKFLRISRTNDYGLFTIRGIAPGRYRIYALNDVNRDYKYDNPNEAIAFYETIIEPTTKRDTRVDTISVKVGNVDIDTLKTIEYTRFIPDDIVMRSFTSAFKRQYLQKHERTQKQISLYFGAPTTMPKLKPLNFSNDEDWYIIEKSKANDTILYWIKDPKISAIDTLSMQVTYLKTDSLNQSFPVTDTLSFIDRTRPNNKKRDEKKKKKEDEEPEITFLDLKCDAAATWDIGRNILFEFGEPITESPAKKIKLQHLVDTTFVDVDFELKTDSLNPRIFKLVHKWDYENEYKVSVDSAAIYSIYGLWNNKYEQKLKIKRKDEYANLAMKTDGLANDSISYFIELLDKSDKPIRKASVKDNVALFKNLPPGQYYARIIFDYNNNGVWDTGDFFENRQPEMVCYYNGSVTVRANWDEEVDWIVSTSNLDKQKPLDITKNKPKEKESKKKQLEQEDKKKQQQNSTQTNNINSTNGVSSTSSYR